MADQIQFPPAPKGPGPTPFGAGGAAGGGTHRLEGDLYDCEVEGKIPEDLDGAFYRVGPDPQYPKDPKWQFDIPFDGEGHASMFRIKDGHVDFKSRWVKRSAGKRSMPRAARYSVCIVIRTRMIHRSKASRAARRTRKCGFTTASCLRSRRIRRPL